jgi:hypothetical protein
VYAGVTTLAVAMVSFDSTSAGAVQTVSHTFEDVACTAKVGAGELQQLQDITVGYVVPDTVAPGETFTVTFPGGSALLPSASSGLTITSFSNLSLTHQINNAEFVAGSIVNPGTAQIDPTNPALPNQTITQTSELVAPNRIKNGTPGPFPPGTLTTPTITVQAVAPASGEVTLQAFQLTTTALLNGLISAAVTCAIPNDIIATIPVVAGGTTTVAPTTAPPTTVAPTTVAPTTVPGTTVAPTTVPGTTVAPTTVPGTTVAPTTVPGTTVAPTTVAPTTVPATTVAPTTAPPTTVATTTVAPTTAAPTTTVAPATTTTVVQQATTTVPAQQGSKTSQSTDVNDCTSKVDLVEPPGNLLPPDASNVTVTLKTTAFPDPHNGDQIQLTNSSITIAVGADLLQTGVDAGIISDGLVIPSEITLVVKGDGTTQNTRTFTVNGNATVEVENGQAKPLTATLALPNSTWTPVDDQTPVIFTEQSMVIVSDIAAIIGDLVATFDCEPSEAPAFMVLPAFEDQVVTVTTLGNTPGGGTTPTAGGTVAPQAPGGGTLPRTGGSVLFWLVLAAICLDLGIVALLGTRRKVTRFLQR